MDMDAMKTTITIEQFENGISIVETDHEGTTSMVSLAHSMHADIGKMVWEDVKHTMDAELRNKVKMDITITAID